MIMSAALTNLVVFMLKFIVDKWRYGNLLVMVRMRVQLQSDVEIDGR